MRKPFACGILVLLSFFLLALNAPTNLHIGPSIVANDFSGDSNCKALWNLENGALTTDSKGTNTLTDNNTVGTSTVDYKQGSASGDFERTNTESLSITDANLNSGFPLKSSESNKVMSLCAWIKLESTSINAIILSKYATAGNNRTFIVQINGSNDTVSFGIGYNSGASAEYFTTSAALVSGRWYHLAVTFDDSSKAYHVRIWDDTAASIVEDTSGNFTNNIYLGTADFYIGGRAGSSDNFDGLIDEVVVTSDILSTTEIDSIRNGNYPGAYTLSAEAGSYTLSGQASGLLKASVIAAAGGTYTLSGQDASLDHGFYLGADGGSYVLSGQDLTFIRDLVVAAAAGSYVLSGQDANLAFGFLLSAESGSYVLSGQEAAVVRSLLLDASGGAYDLVGSDAELTYTPAVLVAGAPTFLELRPLLRQ